MSIGNSQNELNCFHHHDDDNDGADYLSNVKNKSKYDNSVNDLMSRKYMSSSIINDKSKIIDGNTSGDENISSVSLNNCNT